MKRVWLSLIAAALILLFAATAFAQMTDEGSLTGIWHVTTGNSKPLNVREDPSTKGRIVAKLNNGTDVEIVTEMYGGWVEILYNGRYGYCKSEFLTEGASPVKPKTTTASASKKKTTSTRKTSSSSSYDVEYVQCPDCGNWYEAGNVYRNHYCTGRTQSVQCFLCGQWFDSQAALDRHNCPAEPHLQYCPICGQWVEGGNAFDNHECIPIGKG